MFLRVRSVYLITVDTDPTAAQELLMEIIVQSVLDYQELKARKMIKHGRPDYSVINKCPKLPRNMTHEEVEGVCGFVWGGWMAAYIELAHLRIHPTIIYKVLEPKRWKSLISVHQKA